MERNVTDRERTGTCIIRQSSQGSVVIISGGLCVQVLQVKVFHNTKGTASLRILACRWQPFPPQTLDPPIAGFPHLVAVAVIHCDFMNASGMENKKRFGDGSWIDT